MTSLSTLLTLPITSKGFSELKNSVSETHIPQNGSASCRKVPRLNTGSDAASASRSQAAAAATLSGPQKSGPLTVRLVGGDFRGFCSILSDPWFLILYVQRTSQSPGTKSSRSYAELSVSSSTQVRTKSYPPRTMQFILHVALSSAL